MGGLDNKQGSNEKLQGTQQMCLITSPADIQKHRLEAPTRATSVSAKRRYLQHSSTVAPKHGWERGKCLLGILLYLGMVCTLKNSARND